jgi:hypothetical protein
MSTGDNIDKLHSRMIEYACKRAPLFIYSSAPSEPPDYRMLLLTFRVGLSLSVH